MDDFQFDTLQLAYLVSKFGLSFAHMTHISEFYDSLELAMTDKFSKLDPKKCLAKAKLVAIDDKIFDAPFVEFVQLLSDNQIQLLSYQDINYPPEFIELSNPPVILFYQGDIDLLSSQYNKMTIIGSRNIKPYTQIILPHLVSNSISQGLITVSGLALGVDSLVHTMSVNQGKPTIAIIGSGLDDTSFYPFENLGLKIQIINNGGLVMSEYAPNTPPNRYNFPHRNRLLAALSSICFVAQASYKSGSLITVTQAQKIGRQIIAIPANITEGEYEGNLELLQSGSAKLIMTSNDVEKILGYTKTDKSPTPSISEPKRKEVQLFLESPVLEKLTPEFDSDIHREVWNILSEKPINIEELQRQSGLELGNLQGILTSLELDGIVTSVGSNDWVRE